MNEEGGIVGISVFFTLGVALSALSDLSPAGCYTAAGICCPAGAAALAVFALKGRGRLAAAPVFILLGFLCHCTARICGTGVPEFPVARLCIKKLSALTDSINFSYPHSAALLKALLTGEKSGLEKETIHAFRSSGASHILALSGLHLGVIYAFLDKMTRPLGKTRAASLTRSAAIVLCCGFYALATGASPSIVRAFLFISINETARHQSGRRHNGTNTLCTALTIQLAISPTVIGNIGFQLSYLAMAGIFLLYPKLEKWYPDSGNPILEKVNVFRKIWNAAAISISCQIFTAPLAWHFFHSFPQHFLLTNLLALPLSEGLIITGIATLTAKAAGAEVTLLATMVDGFAEVLENSLKIISGPDVF